MTQGYQPQPTQGMVINPLNLPVGPDGRREWNNGLCDCFGDCGTCFVSWCCPCITYGQLKHRYEYLERNNRPDPEHGGGCCNSDCIIHGILASCGFGFALQFMLRGDIRNKFQINGGAFTDCCTAFCCTPCELTQESRELDALENANRKS